MKEPDNDLVLEMIGEAVMAGAYRAAIRRDPARQRAFGKLAAKRSQRAGELARLVWEQDQKGLV